MKVVKFFADALAGGRTPQELKLSLADNPIGDEGAIHITNALKSSNCPTGFRLNLGANHFCISELNHFITAMRKNTRVVDLRLNVAAISQGIIFAYMEHCCKRNPLIDRYCYGSEDTLSDFKKDLIEMAKIKSNQLCAYRFNDDATHGYRHGTKNPTLFFHCSFFISKHVKLQDIAPVLPQELVDYVKEINDINNWVLPKRLTTALSIGRHPNFK